MNQDYHHHQNNNQHTDDYLYNLILKYKFNEARNAYLLNPKICSYEQKRKNLFYQSPDEGLTCLHLLLRNMSKISSSSSTTTTTTTTTTARRGRRMENKGTSSSSSWYVSEQEQEAVALVETILQMGGKKLVYIRNYDGDTVLHTACWCGTSDDVIQKIIHCGGDGDANANGKELVQMKDDQGCTALQILCRFQDSLDIIKVLVEMGGKELLFMTSDHGWNPLHEACDSGLSLDVVKYIIDVAGKKDIVFEKDNNGWNAFFWACDCGGSLDLGDNYNNAQHDIVEYIINHIGTSLVGQENNDGELPLHVFVRSSEIANIDIDLRVLRSLLQGGMRYDGFKDDEYLIGGLFATFTHDIEEAYTTRETRVKRENPCSIFETLLKHFEFSEETFCRAIDDVIQGAPLLQATITTHHSVKIIELVVDLFPWSISVMDKNGCQPIQIAVDYDLQWEEGLKTLFDHLPTTSKPLIVAARHGVKWENGMKHIVQNNFDALDTVDPITNLHPFALAAAGKESDLTSIHELILCRVDLVVNFLGRD